MAGGKIGMAGDFDKFSDLANDCEVVKLYDPAEGPPTKTSVCVLAISFEPL
jgi:hypothetical protein